MRSVSRLKVEVSSWDVRAKLLRVVFWKVVASGWEGWRGGGELDLLDSPETMTSLSTSTCIGRPGCPGSPGLPGSPGQAWLGLPFDYDGLDDNLAAAACDGCRGNGADDREGENDQRVGFEMSGWLVFIEAH